MTEESGKKSWRTGCGYVFFSLLFFLVVAGLVALRPVRQAKRVEEDLNQRFGRATSYTPNPDGSVTRDRVEVFLAVRKHLREPCATFMDRQARLEKVGESEKSGELSSTEIFDGFKAAFGGGSALLGLMRARNQGLSVEGMGIGEYSYLYVLAYNGQLTAIAGQPEGARLFKPRTRKELTRILRNQLAALETSRHIAEHENLVVDLREEISAMESGAHGVPWQNGLPSNMETSISPFRDRLDALFCEPTARFELRQKNQHPSGLGK